MVGHCKNFELDSKWDRKPLEGFKQRGHWFSVLKGSICSYMENKLQEKRCGREQEAIVRVQLQ